MTYSVGYSVATKADLKALATTDMVNGYVRSVTEERAWYVYISSATDAEASPRILTPASGTGRWFICNSQASQLFGLAAAMNSVLINSGTVTYTYNATNQTLSAAVGGLTNTHIATGAAIAQSKIANLTTDLAGKAATSHTHTVSNISDFNTSVETRIRDHVISGNGIDIVYNDITNKYIISADVDEIIGDIDEVIDTRVGTLLQAGSGVSITIDDDNNRIIISSSGGGGGFASWDDLADDNTDWDALA